MGAACASYLLKQSRGTSHFRQPAPPLAASKPERR
jgi:hypothetical protein